MVRTYMKARSMKSEKGTDCETNQHFHLRIRECQRSFDWVDLPAEHATDLHRSKLLKALFAIHKLLCFYKHSLLYISIICSYKHSLLFYKHSLTMNGLYFPLKMSSIIFQNKELPLSPVHHFSFHSFRSKLAFVLLPGFFYFRLLFLLSLHRVQQSYIPTGLHVRVGFVEKFSRNGSRVLFTPDFLPRFFSSWKRSEASSTYR